MAYKQQPVIYPSKSVAEFGTYGQKSTKMFFSRRFFNGHGIFTGKFMAMRTNIRHNLGTIFKKFKKKKFLSFTNEKFPKTCILMRLVESSQHVLSYRGNRHFA